MLPQYQPYQYSKQSTIVLFVAGLPSLIDLSTVLAFFNDISGNFSLPTNQTVEQLERQASKGCCTLICHDFETARYLLSQRFLQFMGRTLTIMQKRTGIGLIIQNKAVKKSRVILKKVPRFVNEELLRLTLESQFGPLETLFQLKCNNPFDTHLLSRTEGSRFNTYSCYFRNKQDAKKLITQGFMALENGTVIIVQKHKDAYRTRNVHVRHEPKSITITQSHRAPISDIEGAIDQRNNSPLKIASNNLAKVSTKINFDFVSHQFKPTQRAYYSLYAGDMHKSHLALDKNRADYRFNRK